MLHLDHLSGTEEEKTLASGFASSLVMRIFISLGVLAGPRYGC